MNSKKITIKNIQDNGFRIGKALKGKGTEIFSSDEYVIDPQGLIPTGYRYFTHFSNVMRFVYNEEDIDSLYVKRISVGYGDDAKNFSFDNKETSQRVFSIKELFDNNFENVKDILIYKEHTKLHGYLPLSKYKKDLDSQKELMVDLYKLVKTYFSADEMDTDDYDLDIGDDTKDISGHGDYQLVHGENEIVQVMSHCEYVEGKPDNHSSMVDEDFWSCTYEGDMKPYLMELDPKEEVTVYHRKGKDWYVGESLHTQDLLITYFDDENTEVGEVEEDTYYVLATIGDNEELIKKIVEVLNGYRESFSLNSYINNELEIGGYGGQVDFYNDGIVNHALVELIYEDVGDLKSEIQEAITSWKKEDIKREFMTAYQNAIDKNVKIDEDMTVAISTVPTQMVTDVGEVEVTKYKHLKSLHNLGKRFGYELVKTNVSQDITVSAWALKIDEEEYHFDIASVIVDALNDEVPFLDFISNAVDALYKRKIEKLSESKLFEEASHVFVGIKDSLESGNCSYGTDQFIMKHHIDTKKIGGIRGDVLLDMELSNFTKRAVMQAIVCHGGVAC